MEVGDVGTQGADDELAGLIGGGEVAQVYQQAEVVVGGAHIGGELGGVGSGSDERGLVHIEVKDLQLHIHAICQTHQHTDTSGHCLAGHQLQHRVSVVAVSIDDMVYISADTLHLTPLSKNGWASPTRFYSFFIL